MKNCHLLQLLASFATQSERSNAFSSRRINTLKPATAQYQNVCVGSCRRSHRADSDFEEIEDTPTCSHDGHVGSRRSLLHSAGLSLAGTVSSGPLAYLLRILYNDDPSAFATNEQRLAGAGGVNAANAMGLVHFPCPPGTLSNTYHMMRAGESGLEAEGVLSTNPLFLTNREDALTDLGTVQVEEACNEMMSKGINPSVVKYSLASKCIDAANIIATTMMVGRNRIVPEFTFMDPRGAGLWDGKPLASTEAAIWALDAAEAGNEGRDGRPPANDDGTANETLFEQVTRLRQLMSVLETQYSGDSIVLIFPDGTSPALLSCLIAGIPLKNTHALNFMPGELRLGVNMENARQLLDERISSPLYTEAISMGQEELVALRKEEEQMKLLAMEESKKSLVTKPQQVESSPDELIEMQRHRHRARGNDGVTDLGSPDFFSMGAIGAMGYMTTLRVPRDGEDSDGSEKSPQNNPAPALAYAGAGAGAAPIQPYANSTGASVFEPQQVDAPLEVPDNIFHSSADAFQAVQMTATNVVDGNAGMVNPNVFEDVPVVSKQERIDAAEKAMEEYLSQDDGGDEWLTSMKDMMDE